MWIQTRFRVPRHTAIVVVVGEQKLKEWSTNGSLVRTVARAKKNPVESCRGHPQAQAEVATAAQVP